MTKVFDLSCALGHRFEGWFSAIDDFERQCQTGLIRCPVCDRTDVFKVPSSPRLNLLATRSGNSKEPPATDGEAPGGLPRERSGRGRERSLSQQVDAAHLALLLEVISGSEDVGTDFAQEARRIHRGEAEERAIRGQATQEEWRALSDEGIEVLPLLMPDAIKGSVH